MKYFLWHAVLGPTPRLPLTKEEYDALSDAWSVLMVVLPFEEEFDALLQNYIELELGFLETAMHDMVRIQNELVQLRKVRLKFARLLSNLLSTCRSYVDHAPHYLSYFGEETIEQFGQARKSAHQSEFAYRFMEALRNYAQHRGSPLHGTTFNTKRVERGPEQSYNQYSVWASIDADKLREDKKFNRVVASELADNEKLDVLSMVRIYIEKLGDIHASLRSTLQSRVDAATVLLRGAVTKYSDETGESTTGIVFGFSESDTTVEAYQAIPLDVIDLYHHLVSQNRRIVNLRRRFVSNELLPERMRN